MKPTAGYDTRRSFAQKMVNRSLGKFRQYLSGVGRVLLMKNQLWFGDNLQILREEVSDESVDLVYLDPPFNSQANYNVLFKTPDEDAASAQVEAFRDTWTWGSEAKWAFDEIMHAGGSVASIVHALHAALGDSDMMAYLVMMAQRLHELRRVLKPTGSLYLHCDPTASHYLKILLDAIFGPTNFLNEIIWKRTSAHSSARRYGPIHDTLLFYSKRDPHLWNPQYQPYSEEYLDLFFDQVDEDGRRWKRMDLTGAGTRNGETGKPWRGIDITAKGRHWAYPPSHLDKLDRAGKIHWPKKVDGMPRLRQYPEDLPGVAMQDIWTDLKPLHNRAAERLHYPTQKPVALLNRILRCSSNPGQVILDPFCGCGTTVAAAHASDRRWIGIDVAYHAIRVIEDRLKGMGGEASYDLGGIPRDFASAARLADRDKYQFQWWANYLVGVQALKEIRKGPDRGIDGQCTS
ncbi:site-specific DNA-methyltransferase [Mesorhizobium newzealandense]|uniref:Methyltransferase n=1 Tax=Mesorhizobium newzealandense TaxID=1300302 RepID=A0ABW4U7R3_9HYPH